MGVLEGLREKYDKKKEENKSNEVKVISVENIEEEEDSSEVIEREDKGIKNTLRTIANLGVKELKERLKGMEDKDLIKAVSVAIDKLQLLNSKPTKITASYNFNRQELLLKIKKHAKLEKVKLSEQEAKERLNNVLMPRSENN